MYIAPEFDRAWLRDVQRKLYARSWEQPDYAWRELWGLVTDRRNLRLALVRVARNKGARTAGVDGITVRQVLRAGGDALVERLREELRQGRYRPSPVRRVRIPKAGKPGEFRPLGIPTVSDRVVQAALKNILEPIFEADFYPVSYGFRPGRSAAAALEHLRMLLRPKRVRSTGEPRRLAYQFAIEGDIKGCFDHIDHHALMVRLRRRVGDRKASRLVLAFLKAGVLEEMEHHRTDSGTPQGGILSPLLANIALSAIEERYERHVWPRRTPKLWTDPVAIEKRAAGTRNYDRRRGSAIRFPIRYADDFIVLVGKPSDDAPWREVERVAHEEKESLEKDLRERLHLELSEEKTLVTPVTKPMLFLGHHVRVRAHPSHGRMVVHIVIPRERTQRLRERIKSVFRRSTAGTTLASRLHTLNPMLRGWCYFYRHAWGAKRVFSRLDSYVWWTILRWLGKKHPRAAKGKLARQFGWKKPGGHGLRWRDGDATPFEAASVRVSHFYVGSMRPPLFTSTSRESPVRNERRTPGSGRGARRPPGAT
jgi:group II intron reverse transcriptase/maturase